MPIYEYTCEACNANTEVICSVDEYRECVDCSQCGKKAVRTFTPSGHYCSNQDADWLKKVLEVVDKEDRTPSTQAFLQHPTRSNYRQWMKDKGIRPLEDGERFEKPKPYVPSTKLLLDRLMERKRIEI